MAPSFGLLGPPELQENQQNSRSSSSSFNTGNDFMNLMVSNYNKTQLPVNPPMGFTENQSPTFLTSGNPCVDFFFHIVPNTPSYSLVQRLEAAWKHNDLTALKLICHLRGVRGTGKSDKEGFYAAALWLHKHHPRTLACNVKSIAEFGYFKDLPELLYRILEGSEVRRAAREESQRRKKLRMPKGYPANLRGERFCGNRQQGLNRRNMMGTNRRIPVEKRLADEMRKVEIQKKTSKDLRKEKKIKKARKAVERYSRDPDFRFLHDQISHVFADYLVSDLKSLKSGEFGTISLASKWCPSLDSSFDKATLLCESIARKVFPRESYSGYEGVEDAHYAYRVRDRLRKEILAPLRQVLELPEIYMSSKNWDSLPYNRVASIAMSNYKKHFLKHDENRFNEFLDKVERGEAKIAAGALFPHDIIKRLNDGENDGGRVAELQWKRMVDDLSEKGKLQNCIAVCDVSGSMSGEPMEVCVALGLLLSELSEHPWNGQVITFSETPKLHKIEGGNLRSKTQFIRIMEAGYNTDFQKVFDLLLQVAVAGNLDQDKMIKKIFVFSDMEFDNARRPYGGYPGYLYGGFPPGYGYNTVVQETNWDTDYNMIKKKFEEKGYTVPEMVFWNLRDSMATPVSSHQKGVALVGGFSKNLMKLFLGGEDMPDSEGVMELALSGPEYQQLAVID